jgi:hypothetical protein
MFRIESEDALLESFRPKDRKAVELPRGLNMPLFVRDYLAWSHPVGGFTYLVFAVPDGAPTGIVFETNGAGAALVPQMCDWCHCAGLGSTVGLLTAQLNSKKRVGVNVCSDLSCKQKLEEEADRSGRSVLPAMQRLIERMGRFASEALRIDLSGSRR